MLGDIAGFARRLEEGQDELTTRLDRIIELLEALAGQTDAPAVLRSVSVPQATA